MAKHCINIKSKEYKDLLALTGWDGLKLHNEVSKWQEENNSTDFPTLEDLGIDSTNITAITKLFEEFPQLFKIGTVEQYDNYLKSLGVTQIAYHHSDNDIENFFPFPNGYFPNELRKKGTYYPEVDNVVFFVDKPLQEEFMSRRSFLGTWGLRTPRTLQFNAGEKVGDGVHSGIDEGIKAGITGGYDAVSFGRIRDNKTWSEVRAIFNPKNAIKLGSKEDIEGFKRYVTNTIRTNANIKEGVNELFRSNPELSKIGNQLQYSNYLNTIFPNSKVQDIVYHFSNVKIDKPNKEKFCLSANINRRKGFFGTNKNINPGNNFANVEGTISHAMLFDMKNPDFGDFSIIPPVVAKDETKDSAIIKQRGDINYYSVFEPEQIHILGNKNDIEGFKKFLGGEKFQTVKPQTPSFIEKTDRIIWGHPGIGKTYLKESGRTDVIDFDSDYKVMINEKFNLPEGFKARNDFQRTNKEEYQQAVRDLWAQAKEESRLTGKRLFASDMILLREFANDFDKVITMSKQTFIDRAKQRNDYTPGPEGTEGWKNNLDIAIGKVDPSKLIYTNKYLSDLMQNVPMNFLPSSDIRKASFAYVDPISNAKKIDDDTYETKDGKKYGTVTSSLIPSMQMKPFTPTDTFGTRQANNFWRNKSHEEKLKFSNIPVPVTYEEFVTTTDNNYELGRQKGVLFHAIISAHITKDYGKLAELYSKAAVYENEFDWLDEKMIVRILEKTGTDAFNKDGKGKDKLYSEVALTNNILKVGGTIDLVIDHGDNVYSVYDLKTGRHFNKLFELDFFKYGRTGTRDIFVSPRNKAKLQVMLYAMLLKMEKPDARFKNLELLFVANKYAVNDIDSLRHIDVPAYLEMIEGFLKNERPDEYKEMLAKHKGIFDPKTYNYIKQESTADTAEQIRLKTLTLQSLVMYDKDLYKNITSGKYAGKDRYEQIAMLTKEIAELRNSATDLSSWDTDMGWMDRWLGSPTASTNPHVKLYYSALSTQKQKARNQYRGWRAKFDVVLNNLIMKKTGKPFTKYVGGVNRTKLFEFAFNGTKLYHSEDPEYKKFSAEEKAFLDFVQESVEMFFVDEKANYDNQKVALANRVVTFAMRGTKTEDITNLDVFNGKFSPNARQEFKYYKGFFPKFAPQVYDVANKYTMFSKQMKDFIYNKYFTNYYESVFDRWDSKEAIPMKYLDNDSILDNENYTKNLELSLDNFVKQYYYKLHLDEVYALGQGLKIFLDYQSRIGNGVEFDRLKDWLDDSINLHILGKKNQDLPFSGRSSGKLTEQGYKQFNGVKFLRSVKNFFAGPTMWLKVFSGGMNAVFANLVTYKEALRNSLFKNNTNAAFTISDLNAGYAEAMKLFGLEMYSDDHHRKSKTYLLMEKFGYLPDNVDWYVSKNELITANNKFFTTKTMLMFHSVPEEILATAIFVAQMKAMKTVDKNGKAISMWDAYDVVEQKDTKANTVQYIGGVRGKRNVSAFNDNPQYKDVGELEQEEINSIKFLYEKIHGGYRADERSAAEYHIFGELMMQLKRYMPSILKNVWASKGVRDTEGIFKEVDENGVKVLKWTPAVIEGRWKMLIGMLYNFVSIRSNLPGQKGSKLRQLLGIQFDESYSWDSLSDQQKDDMKDFMLTSAIYLLLFISGKMVWDDDDDSSVKKMYGRIAGDFASYVNPIEIVRNVVNLSAPVSAKKSIKMLDASAEFFWASMMLGAGYDDKALTKDGNLRGSNELQRSIHFLSAYHDAFSKVEESNALSEFFNVRTK